MTSEKRKLKSGHEVVSVTGDVLEDLSNNFEAIKWGGAIRMQPDDWFYLRSFPKYADRFYEFKFKPSDVLIMTYPKSGTTWTQEIVWTMRNNINFDNPEAKESIMLRSPFMESDFFFDDFPLAKEMAAQDDSFFKYFMKICPDRNPEDGLFMQISECLPGLRNLKTHLPFSLFSPKLLDTCKVIYVARNPKDVCVSYYHHHQLMKIMKYVGSWEKFTQAFMDNNLLYSPYWTHLKEAWDRRNHPNLLFCFYEEMKENPRKNIEKMNKFLNTDLTENQIDAVLNHTSFSSMKKRDTFLGKPEEVSIYMDEKVYQQEGGFFRKGESGSYKAKFTNEQENKFDAWAKENIARNFGEDFLYRKYF